MPRFIFVLIATVLLCPSFGVCGEDDPLVSLSYITEEFKPYNYQEKGVAKGVSIDLLKMVWNELDIAEQPIHFMPWARGYETAITQPGTVLFATTKTEERKDMFRWAGPIAYSRTVMIGLRDRSISIQKPEDLNGYIVGVIRDYPAQSLLAQYDSLIRIDVSANFEMCLNKLEMGRVDLISTEETAFFKALNEMNKKPEQFETAWLVSDTTSHFAFNRKTSPLTVERFQRALDVVMKTPEYKKMYDSYMK